MVSAPEALNPILSTRFSLHLAENEGDTTQNEINTSWGLSIVIVLLMMALFTSYILQTRKIQAVHETVLSIFAGMLQRANQV